MKKYRIAHTELTSALPKDIWMIWADVANWPDWDSGLESCALNGEFDTGHSFMLTPKGSPHPLEVHFVDVVPHERFVDECKLPFGTIRASHTIEQEGNSTRVIHVIEAEIAPDQAEFFEQAIWSGMEKGVPQSVQNLKNLAEKRK